MTPRRTLLLLMLLVVGFASDLRASEYPPPPATAIDAIWASERDPDIQWKDDLEATVRHNRGRWSDRINKQHKGALEREQRLHLRLAVLLEKALTRFKLDERAIVFRIAEHYLAAGQEGVAFQRLVDLTASRPGDAATAIEALTFIHRQANWRDDGGEGDHGRAWEAYAARRLVALANAGWLDPASQPAVRAMQSLAQVHIEEGEYDRAAALLERAAATGVERDAARLIQADLDLAVGRLTEAVAALKELKHPGSPAAQRLEKVEPLAATIHRRELPIDRSAELRWQTLQRADAEHRAPRATEALAALATSDGLIPLGPDRYAGVATVFERMLADEDAESLRAAQRAAEEAVLNALQQAQRQGDAQALLSVYRRWPWSTVGHQAAMDYAAEQLRRGAAAEARRTFTELLGRTDDPARVRQARVGRWLALAQQPAGRDQLRHELREIDPQAAYPWFNGPIEGRQLRDALVEAIGSESIRPSTAPGNPAMVTAPGTWRSGGNAPPGEIGEHLPPIRHAAVGVEHLVVIAGPDGLRAVDPADGRVVWSRSQPPIIDEADAIDASTLLPRDTPVPVAADGRLVTRWGVTPTGRYAAIAAIDARTGRTLWTSLTPGATASLRPVGRPAVAERRVHALMRGRIEPGAGRTPLTLVSFDLDTGQLIWQRRLGSVVSAVAFDPTSVDGPRVDLLHDSTAIAVADGRLYIAGPGMTLAADVRDGRVEWLNTHDSPPPATTARAILSRRPTPPLVLDEYVITAPRDRHGVRAVRRDTGETAWEDPFQTADRLLGAAGQTLFAASPHGLVAINANDGRVVWRQSTGDRIDAAMMPDASTILSAGPAGVTRVDAATGAIEQTLADEPIDALAMVRSQPIMIRRQPGEASAGDALPTLDVRVDPAYPGAEAEARLRTGGNRLALIDPSVGPAKRALVFGDGGATLIDVGDKPRVVWRQHVPPGAASVHWSRFAVTLVYHRRVIGLTLDDGRVVFDRRHDVPIDLARSEQRYLVLARTDSQRGESWSDLTMIDTETGERLWHRTLADYGRDRRFVGVANATWRQRKLLVLAGVQIPGSRFAQLTIDPATGRVEAVEPIIENNGRWPEATAAGEDRWWLITDGRELLAARFDQPDKPEKYRGQFKDFHPHHGRRFDAVGDYLLFDRPDDNKHWIAEADRPDAVQEHERAGYLRNGRRHTFDGQTLTAFDPKDGNSAQAGYQISSEGHRTTDIALVDFWYDREDRLHVISAHRLERSDRLRLRLDHFSPDGAFLGAQVLGHLPAGLADHLTLLATERGRAMPVRRIDDRVVVVADGRTTLHPVQANHGRMRRRAGAVALRVDGPGMPGGSLNGRPSTPAHPVRGRAGRAADVRLTWRDDALHLAATIDDATADGHAGDPGQGDRLIAIVHADGRVSQHVLGVGPSGSSLTSTGGVAATGAAGIDGRTGRRSYELTVSPTDKPLASVNDLAVHLRWYDGSAGDDPVAIWPADDGSGSKRAAVWPRPIEGGTLDAVVALAEQLPNLPATRRVVIETAGDLSGDAALSLDFVGRVLRAAPDAPFVYQMLCMLDTSLRRRPDDPRVVEVVTRLAESAGVPAQLRQRYRAMSGAAFSQWYFVPVGRAPSQSRLMLHDGRRWAAEMVLGNHRHEAFEDGARREAWHLGPMRIDRWTEMRLPMLAMGMHDQPIDGIRFERTTDGEIYWDDSAVIANGQTQVFIGDDTPAGRRDGAGWDWTDKIKRSGRKSHTSDGKRGSTTSHAIVNMKSRVGFHLQPRQPDGRPTDAQQARAIIERQLPRLGATAQARILFEVLLEGDRTDQQRLDRHFRFLQQIPAHPDRLDLADRIVKLAKQTGTDATREKVSRHLADPRMPVDAAYRIRRNYLEPHRRFVREWLIHGPLTHREGPEQVHADDRIDPARPLESVKREEWKAHRSDDGKIDLGRLFPGAGRAGALGLCWVTTDRPRNLKLAMGADDTAKVWVNGRLIHRHDEYPGSGPGTVSADLPLQRGRNLVVLKITNTGGGPWYYYFEMVDPSPDGTLDGVLTTIQPPTP